jgi:hypothetical protein
MSYRDPVPQWKTPGIVERARYFLGICPIVSSFFPGGCPVFLKFEPVLPARPKGKTPLLKNGRFFFHVMASLAQGSASCWSNAPRQAWPRRKHEARQGRWTQTGHDERKTGSGQTAPGQWRATTRGGDKPGRLGPDPLPIAAGIGSRRKLSAGPGAAQEGLANRRLRDGPFPRGLLTPFRGRSGLAGPSGSVDRRREWAGLPSSSSEAPVNNRRGLAAIEEAR